MLGGAAKGSYARLESAFESYYPPLRNLIRTYALDGIDLDVEEPMSLAGVIHLIDQLRSDFGPDFIITLAPVASALLDARRNLSGFDYEALEVMRGKEISWYNAQFYCGWGDCASPLMYEMILARGWPAEKVVVGLVTNPENGSGWVPWQMLGSVIPALVGRHARFGGVMGWEYFNSLPGGKERPWEWARFMTALLRGERTVWDALMDGITSAKTQDVVVADKKLAARPIDDENEEGGEAADAAVPEPFEYYSDGTADE